MNRAIADILANKLDMAYIDRKAGLVQTFEKAIEQDSGAIVPSNNPPTSKPIVKRLPYAYINNELIDMIPDSTYKCMVYFEDNGISSPVSVRNGWSYTSRLRLVCWINTLLISGKQDSTIAAKIMAQIISKIAGVNPFNSSPFVTVMPMVAAIPAVDKNIFSKYDYDEAVRQYLMLPYDYFAIDFQVQYSVPTSCLQDITITNPTPC